MENIKSLPNDKNKKMSTGEEKKELDMNMEIKEDISQSHFQDKENSPPSITRIKKDKSDHQCELCGKTFKHESRLKRHVATHTGADKVQCEICSRILGARDQYVVHMKRLHNMDVTKTNEGVTRKKCFACDICGKIFINNYKLRRHMNVHTGEDKTQCIICSKWIATKHALAKHMERHEQQQNESMSVKCNLCNEMFPSVQELLIHLDVHPDEEQYVCSLCNASNLKTKSADVSYKKKNDFMLHIMSAHPTIKYDKLKPKKINECHLCGKSFPGHSALLRHINYHTREKQIECKLCHKFVANKDHLPLHLARYHPPLYAKVKEMMPKKSSGFTCEFCGEKFPGRHKLETHRKAHEMYQCPLCPTRLQTEDNWRKHMQLHVESGGYNGDVSTMMPVKETLVPQFEPERKEKLSKGDFIIGLMDNDFKDVLPEGLASYSDDFNDNEHYENDFKDEQDHLNNLESEENKKSLDDVNYSSSSATKKKMRKRPKKSRYACKVCDKTCLTYSRLQRHMNSHTGMDRVKCRICKKTISNKDHLEMHLKRKHPHVYEKLNKLYSKKEAGFPCEGCSKSFTSRCKLEKHIKVHPKTYQCRFCEHRYHTSIGMRRHLNSHSEAKGSDDVEKILLESLTNIKQEVSKNESKFDWIMKMMENDYMNLFKPDDDDTDFFDNEEKDVDPENIESMDVKESEQNYEDDLPNYVEEDIPTPNTMINKCDTSAKFFSCNFCSREFFLHDELKLHVLQHIQVLTFECDTCNEVFALRKLIKMHSLSCTGQNRRVEKKEELVCQECDIYFYQPIDQSNHHKLFHEDFLPIKEELDDENLNDNDWDAVADSSIKLNIEKSLQLKRDLEVQTVHCKQELETKEDAESNNDLREI